MTRRDAAFVVATFIAFAGILGSGSGCGGAADAAKPLPDLRDVPVLDCGLSVSRAYALIPHRRTEFDTALATMPRRERTYLNLVFHVIDQTIVLRVAAYRDFLKDQEQIAKYIRALRQDVAFLRKVDPPPRLKAYQELLIIAIAEQTKFFAEWSEMGARVHHATPGALSSYPRVRPASQALQRAHNLLLEAFPSEIQATKDAFFDYHDALDFE